MPEGVVKVSVRGLKVVALLMVLESAFHSWINGELHENNLKVAIRGTN